MRRPTAFTLIELLVVIAILALLISILLPALSGAKERGRRVVCASQLRQLTIALKQYADDYKDRCFNYDWNHIYLKALQPYHLNIYDLRYCPTAKTPARLVNSAQGSATAGWRLGKEDGSYGYNGYFYAIARNDPQLGYSPYPMQAWWQTLAPVDRPDNVPVFADANWIDGWPTHDDTVPADLTTGWDFGTPYYPRQMGRFCLARHGQHITVGFIDGHAALVPLRKLWALQWSRAFELQGDKAGL